MCCCLSLFRCGHHGAPGAVVLLAARDEGLGSLLWVRWQRTRYRPQNSARQLHSFDIIIIELSKTLLWWNPLIWILQKEIRTIHELIADQETISVYPESYRDVIKYQLVNYAVSPIANAFFTQSYQCITRFYVQV